MKLSTILAAVTLTILACALAGLAGASDGLKGFVRVASPAAAAAAIYLVHRRARTIP